jgi:uncharacterized protein (UPF0276 family)
MRYPGLGFGLGLRVQHYEALMSPQPEVEWLEILSENFMVDGGRPLQKLAGFRERYPLVMHGVSLSIGSADPLNLEYLRRLKALARSIEPAWISDHLCWTGVDGAQLHDLMPLPFTEEGLRHVSERIQQVQDFLGRRLVLENVSSYAEFKCAEMPEWTFLAELARRADCLILLDVNNVYVSSRNHGFDPYEYLRNIPVERVQQFHLAGHSDEQALLIDTHDAPVVDAVWLLYEAAVRRFGEVSTIIERDASVPPLETLLAELGQARRLAQPPERAVA